MINSRSCHPESALDDYNVAGDFHDALDKEVEILLEDATDPSPSRCTKDCPTSGSLR